MKLNDRAIEALAQLDGNHAFGVFLEHLEAALREKNDEMRAANELLLIGRCQGAADTIDELLKQARTARDIVARRN